MIRRIREYVTHSLIEEKERWILWFPVAMGIGILLYFFLPTEPRPFTGLYALLITLPSLWRWKRFPALRFILLIGLGGALGFTSIQWQYSRLHPTILQKPIRMVTLQGHLAQVIDTEGGMKLLIRKPVIQNSYHPVELPMTIRLNLRKPDLRLQVGQEIRLRAGLFPLPQPALPGDFDIARHFYFQGIGAVGYGLAPVEIIKTTESGSAEEWLNAVRGRFSRRIRSAITGAEGAIADALITGEQSAIPKLVREEMAVAGIAHMLSISGVHMSLVAGLLFITLRFVMVLIPGIALHYPIKKWAAFCALLVSFGYLALAGFPVAANRSFLMVSLVLGGVMLDRKVLSLRSVALAAMLILSITPESLLGPSFQLSFAATIAIIACYERFSRQPSSTRFYDWWLMRPWFYLTGIAITSLVAGIATTPYVMLHFHQLTVYHILANVLTAPLLSLVVMPAGLLAVLLMPLGCEELALMLMKWGITQILSIAQWVAGLPLAVSYAPGFPAWGIACFTLGGLWLCSWQKRWRIAGIPFIIVGMFSFLTIKQPDIVISPQAQQIALRNGNGQYAMLKGSTRNFTAKIWMESLGIQQFESIKEIDDISCDTEGCLLTRLGYKAAFPKQRMAAIEDCEKSDIMVADFYTNCTSIKFAFARPEEAIALWITYNGIKLQKAKSFVSRIQRK